MLTKNVQNGARHLVILAMITLSGCSTLVLNDDSQPSATQPSKVIVIEPNKPKEPATVSKPAEPTPSANEPAKTISPYHREEDVAAERLLGQARTQMEKGLFSLAAATTERAIRISPKYVNNYITLARIKLSQEQYAEAEQIAEKGLSLMKANRWFFESQEERTLRLIVNRARHEQGE